MKRQQYGPWVRVTTTEPTTCSICRETIPTGCPVWKNTVYVTPRLCGACGVRLFRDVSNEQREGVNT